jgi:hypothetical protein
MAKTLQFRRGTTEQLNAIIGAEAELFVDLTTNTIRVHDGTTIGGHVLGDYNNLINKPDLTVFDNLTVGNGTNAILGIDTTTTAVASTTATIIESFSATTYRSAKLQIQITQGTNYQVSDILIIHDGTISTLIESATLSSDVLLSTFSTAIETGNVVVKTTMFSADSATVKVVSSKITV